MTWCGGVSIRTCNAASEALCLCAMYGRVPARSGHAPASYCPRRKTTGMAAVVGWAATVEGQVSGLPGERQVVLLSLSISVFIYLFCSVLF